MPTKDTQNKVALSRILSKGIPSSAPIIINMTEKELADLFASRVQDFYKYNIISMHILDLMVEKPVHTYKKKLSL